MSIIFDTHQFSAIYIQTYENNQTIMLKLCNDQECQMFLHLYHHFIFELIRINVI